MGYKIAIFASGSGTNAEKLMEHFREHTSVSVALILSNNAEAFVLQRAARFGVPAVVFTKHQFRESDAVLELLRSHGITHVVLAGFLWLMPPNILNAFPNRVVNIHPALLPKFGGKGMYGARVHEAVKQVGEKETGITIHLVNEKYDEGKILFQATCAVMETDTPETIAEKVHALEYKHFSEVVEGWVKDLKSF